MATVIRSPRVSKKPRKLQAETVAAPVYPQVTTEIHELREQSVAAESPLLREAREQYQAPESPLREASATQVEPVITAEELTGLRDRVDRAESGAERAERELDVLRSELESLKAQARESGFAAGREEANRKLDAEYRQRLQAVDKVLESLSAQIEGLVAQAEDSIVETVYAAVVKIIGERLAEPDSIAAVVRHVSMQLVRPEKFTVRLAPADYELIASDRELLLEGVAEKTAVRILPDPRIEAGGCILESAAGSLDARLEVQLQRLKDVLLDSRARRQSELQGKK